jgi:hypothetical protein
VDDSLELARALADVAARHTVDTGWLTAQKDALAVLEVEDTAQLAYEQSGHTSTHALTMPNSTLYELAIEPEPTVDRGFGMDPDL